MNLKRTGVAAGVLLLATSLAIPVSAQASAPTASRPSAGAELASVVQASDAAAANGYTFSVRVSSAGQAAAGGVYMSWGGPDSNVAWISDALDNYATKVTDLGTQTIYSRLGAEYSGGNSTVVTDAAYQRVLDLTGLTDDSWLAEPVPDWVENPGLAADPFSTILANFPEGAKAPGWKRTVKGSTVTYTRGGKLSYTQLSVVATDGLITSIRHRVGADPKVSRTYAYTVVSLDGPAFEVPDISQLDPATPELSQAIQDYLKESYTVSMVLKSVSFGMGGTSLATAKKILAENTRDSGMTVTWVKNTAMVTSPVTAQAAAAGFPDACGTLTVFKNKKPVVGAC